MNGDYTIILVCLKVTCQSKGKHIFTLKYYFARMPIVLATFACSNKRVKSSGEGLTLYMSALEILNGGQFYLLSQSIRPSYSLNLIWLYKPFSVQY